MKRDSAAPLQRRVALWLAGAAAAGSLLYAAINRWPGPQLLAWLRDDLGLAADPEWLRDPLAALAMTLVLLLPLAIWSGRFVLRPVERLLRALEGGVGRYRDGDFNFSIVADRDDDFGDFLRAHNELGRTLREQRRHLVERELLLDTIVQNTPVALVLTDAAARIVYANVAARHLFDEGRSLTGKPFAAMLAAAPEALRRAVDHGSDTLLSMDLDGDEETFHVSQRRFRLHGRPHRLYLFRRMTRELARQEVAAWKRVIRLISHELNNSLAPISSLAHSGAELARRGDTESLPRVFATIAERAGHLNHFIAGYADFAKLPAPCIEAVQWARFLDSLAMHCRFRIDATVPEEAGHFDSAQLEQALINLLKNAHESGSAAGDVTIGIRRAGDEWRIEVADRGSGVNEARLSEALLPFYSTKRAGAGLGLALAREIVEAHGGHIALANRRSGGLRVTLSLPAKAARMAPSVAETDGVASQVGADSCREDCR